MTGEPFFVQISDKGYVSEHLVNNDRLFMSDSYNGKEWERLIYPFCRENIQPSW